MTNAYERYREHMAEIRALNSALGLLSWDQETCMPADGLGARAEARAVLSGLVHDRTVSDELGDLLAELAASGTDGAHAANVRETTRDRDRAVKVPRELVTELARVTTLAQQAWARARQEDDWPLFAPLLTEVLALRRRQAEALGYANEPYDALLEEYEPGARIEEVTRVFADLRAELIPLVAAIGEAGPRDDGALRRRCPRPAQAVLCREVLQTMGFDFQAGRLDTSAHPFTTGVGARDVRLTTHYDEDDLAISLFSTIHEGGHGLYEQGLPAAEAGLPLGEAVSLGIHESQSRLWENQVGRGRAFAAWLLPRLGKHFPGVFDDVDPDTVYAAVNVVRPSPIRIEADEVTYNLHIILRMELERALLRGDIEVDDLPGLWNERMSADLGVSPRNDAEGVLQDIHWSFGLFGYFPTYALGNIYSAQLYEAAGAELPDLDERIARGELRPLLDWLREKIHAHGRRYPAGELCRRATGRDLDSRPFVTYLRRKFGALYHLATGDVRA
jgi:carboxypeptidase Taq